MKKFLVVLFVITWVGVAAAWFVYDFAKKGLPQIITVNDYSPLLVSNVYAKNGEKIGEYFRERRVLTPYKSMPPLLVRAFVAAEDDQFFNHHGINLQSIFRAFMANVKAGKTVQGGSTITQQVAKTLLLTPEKTLLRKVREALLATEMERHLSKEDIMFLYLNQIYFGQGAYGVGMASEIYFRKKVEKLTLAEMAILAGLPQAPSRYSPLKNPQKAKDRQLYVLQRMAAVGFVTQDEANKAAQQPVTVYLKENFQQYAPYYLETLRQMLVAELGEEKVLDQGLRIYTGLDLAKQRGAQDALKSGLRELDKRQGYRGAKLSLSDAKQIEDFLIKSKMQILEEKYPKRVINKQGSFDDIMIERTENSPNSPNLPAFVSIGQLVDGVVRKVDDQLELVTVQIAGGQGLIDLDTMKWARKPNDQIKFEAGQIKKPSEALKVGDVISVKVVEPQFSSERLHKLYFSQPAPAKKGKVVVKVVPPPGMPDFTKYLNLELEQEPLVEGSLISFDQKSQEVVAMVGGANFEKSEFNRSLQAARQTGSSFKAIVYAAALDHSYTPASIVMDAPIVFEEMGEDKEGQGEPKIWKPANHSKSFGGDILFRNALIRSLNVPTVKIIEDIGIPWSMNYARRLGIFSSLNNDFTLALGSSSVTLYEMTKVFSQFGRLGKRIRPLLVQKVESHQGQVIYNTLDLDKRFATETKVLDDEFEVQRKAWLEKKAAEQPNGAGLVPGASPPAGGGVGPAGGPNGAAPAAVAEADGGTAKTNSQVNKKPEVKIFFDDPEQLIKPTTAYIMTSMLRGVINEKGGTGGRARALGRDVAGKTGTTNGYYDAWFIGYTPQIATGVWVGFDSEKTLGQGEVGGRAALPIWLEYMKAAHENLPEENFAVPPGVVHVNIDNDNGRLASSKSRNTVLQAFEEGTEPTSTSSSIRKEEETDFYKQDLNE